MFRILAVRLITIGVLVSFTALIVEEARMINALNGMAREMIKKYDEASFCISGDAFIHFGIYGLREVARNATIKPKTRERTRERVDAFLICISSFAPTALLIIAPIAIAKDEKKEKISQLTVLVRLTADVALAPNLPTIAVSTYCRRVLIISSTTTGKARVMS